MEYFSGPPEVATEELPAIRPISLKPAHPSSLFHRLLHATRKRSFVLVEDWYITLDKVSYNSNLAGKFQIPALDKHGKAISYNGASVPLPWLISLLTIGILRPLGVMLIASIVHDYAYKFGHLKKVGSLNETKETLSVKELACKPVSDGQDSGPAQPANIVEVAISREDADRLFRDLIVSVNQLPLVGQIAWLFVRIGWFFKVRYNGRTYGGKAPIAALLVVTLLLSVLVWLALNIGIANLCLTIVCLYLFAYLAGVILRPDPSAMS